jgi:cellulose synthase/poly-beta-1,6-N-acetylglucosamine synthase-like glycosyltransferase
LAIVIFARDEELVIREALAWLRPQILTGDSLHVVADHCQDETAALAAGHGARVHVRRTGKPGKGPALTWWLERESEAHLPAPGIVILDADSCPSQGMLKALRRQLKAGQPAGQARVVPVVEGSGIIPLLAAFSEEVEQGVSDRLRSLLGWPVRLRGTGMGFQSEVLKEVAGTLSTSVEDAELSLLVTDLGYVVKAVPETCVLDSKPSSATLAERQRARWLQGQGQLVRAHGTRILRTALRGPAGWSLLSSILLKPHSFVLPFKAIAFALGVGLWWAGLAKPPVALLLAGPLLVALFGLLAGLVICPPSGSGRVRGPPEAKSRKREPSDTSHGSEARLVFAPRVIGHSRLPLSIPA